MNVTPRQRTRVEPTRWKLTCGICLHVFEAVSYTHLTLPTNREV